MPGRVLVVGGETVDNTVKKPLPFQGYIKSIVTVMPFAAVESQHLGGEQHDCVSSALCVGTSHSQDIPPRGHPSGTQLMGMRGWDGFFNLAVEPSDGSAPALALLKQTPKLGKLCCRIMRITIRLGPPGTCRTQKWIVHTGTCAWPVHTQASGPQWEERDVAS